MNEHDAARHTPIASGLGATPSSCARPSATGSSTAGGTMVAQDRESSVVYGTNGEAVLAGVTDEVLPLDALAYLLMQAV